MRTYPIRTLAELTGVPAITLRAWERRYGLLKPQRTAKGHRLYSENDIDLINNIVRLLNQNMSISEAIRQLQHGVNAGSAEASKATDEWQKIRQQFLKQIEAFNDDALDSAYSQVLSLYPVDLVTENVILPILKILGERWTEREAGIAEEHFFTAYLRNKLGARLHHEARRSRGQIILAACLPQEHHELGLLLFCLSAIGRGYRIVYLGADMPLKQIPVAAKQTRAAAVLLSGTTITHSPNLIQELVALQTQLTIPLMIGGVIAENSELTQALGTHTLGGQQTAALQQLESLLPVHKK